MFLGVHLEPDGTYWLLFLNDKGEILATTPGRPTRVCEPARLGDDSHLLLLSPFVLSRP